MSNERPYGFYEQGPRPVPKSVKELFQSVVASAERGETRDLHQDLRDYLSVQGVELKAEHQGLPDPNKLLIITPNHHLRKALFSTGESLNIVALSTIGAADAGVSAKHTAWIIKQLDVHKVGPGILARKVQNATIPCYGQIPIKVKRKLERNGSILPRLREKFANIDQFQGLVFKNIMEGNNIGYFPEQTPTRELKQFDPNYPKFIRGLQKNVGEFQIIPVSNYYEGNIAHARFGQVIQVTPESDPSEVARRTMQRIAANLPRRLRGVYS